MINNTTKRKVFILYIKKIFLFALLLGPYRLEVAQAMQESISITDEARSKETNDGYYESPQKIIYKKYGKFKEKTRVEHIEAHLHDDLDEVNYTFFKVGTEVYNDVINFINQIIIEFIRNGIDISNPTATLQPDELVGYIQLQGKAYKVLRSRPPSSGLQNQFTIVPDITSNNPLTNYPPIGIKGGVNGKGESLYAYKLSIGPVPKGDLKGRPSVQNFFPL